MSPEEPKKEEVDKPAPLIQSVNAADLRNFGLNPADFGMGAEVQPTLSGILRRAIRFVCQGEIRREEAEDSANSEAFLAGLESRIVTDELYQKKDSEIFNAVKTGLNRIVEVIRIVIETIVSIMKSCSECLDRDPDNVRLCNIKKRLEDLRRGEIKDVLYILEAMGLLNTDEPLHVEDICGSDGVSLFLISLFRGNDKKTTGRCLEKDDDEKERFDLLRGFFGVQGHEMTFTPCDIRHRKFTTTPKDQGKTFWLSKYPEGMIGHMVDRICTITPEEMPDGIGLVPCLCHAYEDDLYKPGYETFITKQQWHRLVEIVEKGIGHLITEKESILSRKARNIMDCVLASAMNRSNPNVRATVHDLPSLYGNAILIKRAA